MLASRAIARGVGFDVSENDSPRGSIGRGVTRAVPLFSSRIHAAIATRQETRSEVGCVSGSAANDHASSTPWLPLRRARIDFYKVFESLAAIANIECVEGKKDRHIIVVGRRVFCRIVVVWTIDSYAIWETNL